MSVRAAFCNLRQSSNEIGTHDDVQEGKRGAFDMYRKMHIYRLLIIMTRNQKQMDECRKEKEEKK